MNLVAVIQIIYGAASIRLGVIVIASVIILCTAFVVLLFIVMVRARNQKINKANQMQLLASSSDSTWSMEIIESVATETFNRFQADWSVLDSTHMQEYTTESYFNHVNLMMFAMRQMKRQNLMHNLSPPKIVLVEIADSAEDSKDSFIVEISSRADDTLIEYDTDKVLWVDRRGFAKYWSFKKHDGHWLLDSISQDGRVITFANNSKAMKAFIGAVERVSSNAADREIGGFDNTHKAQAFALDNGFYYNADFGWLLLPTAGSLFSGAKFEDTDVNHHVIGVYKDVLVQFFEYLPFARAKKSKMFTSKDIKYAVAAATLPKAYGNILIRPKSFFISIKPAGLTRIQTESADFNKMYELFASDADKTNSFELLHPGFILQMQSLDFKVGLEIVSNILYLFSSDKDAEFNKMLGLLQKAFKEMKM